VHGGKKLECLRNDLAFDVLWVNVPLMKQFGYTVPTTWQQWQTIGRERGCEPPGLYHRRARDSYSDAVYLQAAQCHLNDVVAAVQLLSTRTTQTASTCRPAQPVGERPAQCRPAPRVRVHLREDVRRQGAHDVGPAWYSPRSSRGRVPSSTLPAGTYGANPPLTWREQAGSGPATWAAACGSWSSHLKGAQLKPRETCGRLATSKSVRKTCR